MVDKATIRGRNVVDFLSYQSARRTGSVATPALMAPALSARDCRHCGAALQDGESEDDCSSALIGITAPPRRFYAD